MVKFDLIADDQVVFQCNDRKSLEQNLRYCLDRIECYKKLTIVRINEFKKGDIY